MKTKSENSDSRLNKKIKWYEVIIVPIITGAIIFFVFLNPDKIKTEEIMLTLKIASFIF
jgi:hypothetical protein